MVTAFTRVTFGNFNFIQCLYDWDEVTEEWRKLHIEDLSDMYSLPNIVRVVK